MKRMSLLLLLVVWFCQSVYAVTIGIPEDQSTIQEINDVEKHIENDFRPSDSVSCLNLY